MITDSHMPRRHLTAAAPGILPAEPTTPTRAPQRDASGTFHLRHGAPGPSPVLVPGPTEVLTLQDAAVLLQVDTGALRRLAEAGELPGRQIGGHWRFSRWAVLDWLAQGGATRTAPTHLRRAS